jgi:hypothetical protein
MGKNASARDISSQFELQMGRCALCGTKLSAETMEIDHLAPKSSVDSSNLLILCPDCNASAHSRRFREFDFQQYLLRLIKQNNRFTAVEEEKIIGDRVKYALDIFAIFDGMEIAIEVKSFSYVNRPRIRDLLSQLLLYKRFLTRCRLVLAFPGILNDEDRAIFTKKGIDVWDVTFISNLFVAEIPNTPHPAFASLFSKQPPQKPEEELIVKLSSTACGTKEWSLYQRLLRETLERLFCPLLATPIYEHPDEFNINRRDFILPNYAPDGFWSYMRETYKADFVVVDAKNSCKKVTKRDVLQVSNYLKRHGTGLFGIIIGRQGGDKSSLLTLREIWSNEQKLILILNDEDIKQMLMLKSVGNNPEDVLKEKIQQFRLSI